MADRSRGKTSSDDQFFAPKWLPVFKEAVDDLCYLLTRGYAMNSGLQMVGNRYRLNKRQRSAVQRICSSDQEVERRKAKVVEVDALKGQSVEIDGFNLLILLENALSGAYIFQGRDGTIRDISSVHGSYKRVSQTESAIILTGQILKELSVVQVKWYLDRPISNSGRLKTKLYEISQDHGFNWEVELTYEPDKILGQSQFIIVSSDGWILDQTQRWFNLGEHIIRHHIPEAALIQV